MRPSPANFLAAALEEIAHWRELANGDGVEFSPAQFCGWERALVRVLDQIDGAADLLLHVTPRGSTARYRFEDRLKRARNRLQVDVDLYCIHSARRRAQLAAEIQALKAAR